MSPTDICKRKRHKFGFCHVTVVMWPLPRRAYNKNYCKWILFICTDIRFQDWISSGSGKGLWFSENFGMLSQNGQIYKSITVFTLYLLRTLPMQSYYSVLLRKKVLTPMQKGKCSRGERGMCVYSVKHEKQTHPVNSELNILISVN